MLVEKILEGDETLPASWATARAPPATTRSPRRPGVRRPGRRGGAGRPGHPAARRPRVDWPAMTHVTKRAVADGILRSEVLRLARLVPDVDATPTTRSPSCSASFPVYRTYLPLGARAPRRGRRPRAVGTGPTWPTTLDALRAGAAPTPAPSSRVRFQQTSRHGDGQGRRGLRVLPLDPAHLAHRGRRRPGAVRAVTPAEFHARDGATGSASWPDAMTTLSTHDTKRSEDVRARIAVISRAAGRVGGRGAPAGTGWPRSATGRWRNLLWQAVVGAWPIDRERLHAYAEKAPARPGLAPRWIDPDAAFEAAAARRWSTPSTTTPSCTPAIDGAGRPARGRSGWSNSLSAKLIQLTMPGVPDVYQGTELWDLSLVDPDNRRPVDYGARRRAAGPARRRLAAGRSTTTGAAKLLVTARALRLRRDRPELFTGYTPVTADGRGRRPRARLRPRRRASPSRPGCRSAWPRPAAGGTPR